MSSPAIKSKSNPYKVNQYTAPDPRQAAFLCNYLDPKSPTFSNAYKSALSAGYANEYATEILNLGQSWIKENIDRRKRMLNKAENKLEEHITSKIPAISADVSKFIAKTLGKNEGYSERYEHTGKDGKDLIPKPIMEISEPEKEEKAP